MRVIRARPGAQLDPWSLCLIVMFTAAPTGCAAVPAPALADSDSRVVTSTVTGRDYQVTVALPRGYGDSDERYAVLYAVDANGQLGTVVEAARLMRFDKLVPELIVVGVGYPVGRMVNAQAPRAVDLTPTSDPE